jgi:hypothetical protein
MKETLGSNGCEMWAIQEREKCVIQYGNTLFEKEVQSIKDRIQNG